ncbi:MAG TPA: hypothetical protein VHC69_29185 [Polyangiaceae bacterium]|nr:hypothetical protein [Polyangiaceae bacterium]
MNHAPETAGFVVHCSQQRHQIRLDAETAGEARLRFFDAAVQAIDCLVDVNDAMLEVDVAPFECLELRGAREEVDPEHVAPPPDERHVVAAHRSKELARPQIALLLSRAAIGPLEIRRGVVLANPQTLDLRTA